MASKKNDSAAVKETVCNITRDEFAKGAAPLAVNDLLGGQVAPIHPFSTGSMGWRLNAKQHVTIGGKSVKVNIDLNVTVVGSKELPK